MNGVHDMGGMHGFGPVDPEANERFHADWERRVRALNQLTQGQNLFNIDEFRFGIERMDPADYLASSYFKRWFASLEYNLIQKGIVSAEEVHTRVEYFRQHPDADLPRQPEGQDQWHLVKAPIPPLPEIEPRFGVGDTVIARNVHPVGHTRLPRYVRGKRGVIHLVHGPGLLPDAAAHGRDDIAQVVYNVRFDGQELWGASAEPRQVLYIDLWESYLELVSENGHIQ